MNRDGWVLSVLYSPGKGDSFLEPVNGSLRLMKILFIMGQQNKNLPNFYNAWQKYLYGPCDFEVYSDISNLKQDGLIEEKKIPFQNFTNLSLTKKGADRAKFLFESLEQSVKDLIRSSKKEANNRQSLRNLLEHIYTKYPGWDALSIFRTA